MVNSDKPREDPKTVESPAPELPKESTAAKVKPAASKTAEKTEAKAPAERAAPARPGPLAGPATQAEKSAKTGGGRWGAFFALVLGGALAAVIGFAVARYAVPQGWPFGPSVDRLARIEARVTAQDQKAAALEQGLATAQATLAAQNKTIQDLRGQVAQSDQARAALAQRLEGADSALGQREAALGKTLDALDARLKSLDQAATQAGGAAGADTATLTALRDELAQQKDLTAKLQSELNALGAETKRQIGAATSAETAIKAQIADVARRAGAEAALSRIAAALESGGGFGPALATLQQAGIAVPAALSAVAAKGVARQADLVAAFPEAARAGLAAALKSETKGGWWQRLAAFVQVQTGLRSLQPRPGDSPDAILSRAAGALQAGQLAAALNLVGQLPPPAQAAMTDWIARAQARAAALQAAGDLAVSINAKQ